MHANQSVDISAEKGNEKKYSKQHTVDVLVGYNVHNKTELTTSLKFQKVVN